MIYNGNNKDLKKEFQKILLDENLTLKKVSELLNISNNQLNNTFNKVNLSFTDIYKMLNVIDYDLKVEFVKRNKD